jgi:Tol biopolymer transport system component
MDRSSGVAVLMVQDLETGAIISLSESLPIPKGSGSSIPESANLSWAPDGKSLVFEFGRSASDRAIYLANANGTRLIKLANSAHAPAISADGRCLAYISDKQVFLLDLPGISSTSTTITPVLLADLPAGRSNSDFRLDKLQWAPRQP